MPNLYKGERHLFSHNYTGIGTNLDKRLDLDDEPLPHSLPVNKIDEISRLHDIMYRDYGEIAGRKNLTGQHVADRVMVKMLDDLDPKTLTDEENAQRWLVRNGINIKEKLGFGVSEQEAREMHHKIVRNFPRRKVIVHHVDDIWFADLVEMPPDRVKREDYKYILTVIDLFSRYAWGVALKNKQSQTVIDAFKSIRDRSHRSPAKLWCDMGSEFINKQFKAFLSSIDCELYHTFNEGKAVVIERFNRTLKEKMWLRFTIAGGDEGNKKWFHMLPNLLAEYNNSFHRSIKATPVFASRKENENQIIKNITQVSTLKDNKKPRFK